MIEAIKRMLVGADVLAAARSMRTEPDAWTENGRPFGGDVYEVVHTRSGLTVWVANNAYGMAIHDGDRREPNRIWGGVTALSTFGLSPGHWALWAASRPIVRRLRAAPRRAADVLSGRVS